MGLFIHVGYPKKATTWLQRVVLPQHEGIDYWRFDDSEYAWIQEIVRTHDFDFDPEKFRQQYQQSVLRSGTRSTDGIACIIPRVICSARMVRYASQRITDPLLFSYMCSDKSFIHYAMRSKLGDFYGASNKMLMEKFDLAVDKYGYPIR